MVRQWAVGSSILTNRYQVFVNSLYVRQWALGSSMVRQWAVGSSILTNRFQVLTNYWRTSMDELTNYWRIDEPFGTIDDLTNYWGISEGFVNFTKQSGLTNLSAKWRRFWRNYKLANDMLTSVAYCNNMSVTFWTHWRGAPLDDLTNPWGNCWLCPWLWNHAGLLVTVYLRNLPFIFGMEMSTRADLSEQAKKMFFFYTWGPEGIGEWKPLLLALGVDKGVDTCSCFFTFDKWDG